MKNVIPEKCKKMICFMRKVILAIAVLTAFWPRSASLVVAQDPPAYDMQVLREKINADTRHFIAVNMSLTESENKAFWPIYEAYQKDLEKLNDRSRSVIEQYSRQYGTISDNSARQLLEDYILIERDRQKFREYYLPKLRQILPDKKVARYFQLENKIQAVVNYDLAARIPLIE